MKFSLVLCLAICIVGVYCADDAPKVVGKHNLHTKKCIDESKVDEKIIDAMRENFTLPEVPELKCFLSCMMIKAGALNDDGTFTDKYNEEPECKTKGGNGVCEIAYNTMKCIIEKDNIQFNEKKH